MSNQPTIQALYDKQLQLMKDEPSILSSMIGKIYFEALVHDVVLECFFEPSKIDIANHRHLFDSLLKLNYAYEECCLRKFDMKGVKIDYNGSRDSFKILVPNIHNAELGISPFDYVIVNQGSSIIPFQVSKICRDDWILLKPPPILWHNPLHVTSGQCDIRFSNAGIALRRQIEALEKFHQEEHLKAGFFIDECPCKEEDKYDLGSLEHKWLNRRLEQRCNERQKQAITNILKANCRPRPYILFGPPGTGKTATLVELVIQVFMRDSNSRILISTSSNSCADKLATDISLTGLIEKDDLIRFGSAVYYDRYDKESRYSHYKSTIKANEAGQHRIVVTTNLMSAKISGRFDLVILDEAAHSSEPDALLPIVRCNDDQIVVLAGDHMQLGPVVRCKQAAERGLEESLFKRLRYGIKCYKMIGSNSDIFDQRFITKLTMCYRSDPRIMVVPNAMFYQKGLECLGKTPAGLMSMFGMKHPTRFVDVPTGREARFDPISSSLHNEHEARVCADLVMQLYRLGLEPHQVGVITPYQSQKRLIYRRINDCLHKNADELNDRFKISPEARKRFCGDRANGFYNFNQNGNLKWQCKVDTVDGFQGDEREVIIISLVRTKVFSKAELSADNDDGEQIQNSNNEGADMTPLSFVNDKRRFNVALSRAKWITIVVGKMGVIELSSKWESYIKTSERITAEVDGSDVTYGTVQTPEKRYQSKS